MKKFLPKKNIDNSINHTDLKEGFKLENEKIRLTLRKNKINNIIFEKRKISYKKDNIDEIKKNYGINIEDIQIANKYKIDIQKFCNKVRKLNFYIFYYYSLIYHY